MGHNSPEMMTLDILWMFSFFFFNKSYILSFYALFCYTRAGVLISLLLTTTKKSCVAGYSLNAHLHHNKDIPPILGMKYHTTGMWLVFKYMEKP